MKWKSRNVFVTGGDGFIGGWLVKKLVELEADVILLIRDNKKDLTYKFLGLQGKATEVFGDLKDYDLLKRILTEYSIDTCFHLGAQALVQMATKSPLSTFESNIKGTWNLLEACRNTKTIERIIVASSDKAYGVQKELPYTEKSPLLGMFPYDASKACADILSRAYFVSYGLPVVVTRNGNTYGGGDLNFSRLVPDAICSVLSNKEFEIRSNGNPERDYLYVEDAVQGYVMLAEQIEKKEVKGEAFNFGTEEPISVLELFRKITRLCGKPKIKPKILGSAKNEIDRQYLSSDKAKKILKWQPQHSLEEGLKKTLKWYRLFLKGRRIINE